MVDIARDLDQRSLDFSPAEIDEIRRIYPSNAAEILAADAARYRETIRGLVRSGLPGAHAGEWDDFVTLRGQYQSKVGLRQGAVELGTDLATARREVQRSASRPALLPLNLADALVPREDWICAFRRIAREVRGASFCAGTFTAVELRRSCDDR